MTDIIQTRSAPSYIESFIQENKEQLFEIYEGGLKAYGVGCVGMNCSESDNKMDVFFMNKEIMDNMMDSESSEKLLSSINNRRLFFVKDIDLNSVFLIYL